MPDFIQIRASNPGAVPNGSDIVVVQKADGTPAGYTLTELATFINGITTPTWQTDAAHGCYLRVIPDGNATQQQTNSVIAFNQVVRDTGFYTSQGTVTIPAGVIRIQIVAQVKSSGTNPILSILKNGDTALPVAKVVGAGGYCLIVSPEITVSAGQTFQIHCANVTNIYATTETFFNVRTIEKTP